MSTDTTSAGIPQWDIADRMRKALRDSGVGVQEMAIYLDVSRNTVGNYINGHTPPPGPALRLWALRCGVPLQWLRDGVGESGPTPGEGVANPRLGRVLGFHAVRRGSNLGLRRVMPYSVPSAA